MTTPIEQKRVLHNSEALETQYNLDVLRELSHQSVDPFTYYASLAARKEAVQHHSDFVNGQISLLSPEMRSIVEEQVLHSPASKYIVVVGGGATAVAAIQEALKTDKESRQHPAIVVHFYDPKDIAGQTKLISWDIHQDRPISAQKDSVKAFSRPGVLSIGQRLSESQINEVANRINADFVIDARGVTKEDETRLSPKDGGTIKYGLDNKILVSREFIPLVHDAMDKLDTNPELMINLLNTLDLEHVVIAGAGKVATQDLIAKVRLLQIAQKVYKDNGILIDFQKFSEGFPEDCVVMKNAERIGITAKDLGSITIVNRSLPRIIDASEKHLADTHLSLLRSNEFSPEYAKQRFELYKRIKASNHYSSYNEAMDAITKHLDALANGQKLTDSTLNPNSIKLIKEFLKIYESPNDELVRKHSAVFRQDTLATLKKWQDGYGFDFVEGVVPDHVDNVTREISFKKSSNFDSSIHVPTHATTLLTALGVKSYEYTFEAEGDVAGMRARGSGKIADSAAHAKAILQKFFEIHSSDAPKTIEDNQKLLEAYQSLTEYLRPGDPLGDMLTLSPQLLTRHWVEKPLSNPGESLNIDDANVLISREITNLLTADSHLLLTYIAKKIGNNSSNEIITALKKLKLEELSLQPVTELGRNYQEIVVNSLALPFRLRLDEHGKLWFTNAAQDKKTNWTKINNLTQFDHLIRSELMIDSALAPSYSEKEDRLLDRFTNTREIIESDLLNRFLGISIRNKYQYTNEQMNNLDISAIVKKLYLSPNGIRHSNYPSILSQSEFDHILDQWYSSHQLATLPKHAVERVKKSLSEAKKYQVAAESILSFLAGGLLSVSGLDRDTVAATLTSSVALSGAAKVITASARLLTKNPSNPTNKIINRLEDIAEHVALISGWAMFGFGITEWVNPSPSVSVTVPDPAEHNQKFASGLATINPPDQAGTIIEPSPSTLAIEPPIISPTPDLIPLNFSQLSDTELLNHLRTVLGDNNWKNYGPFHGYNGRPVELADVLLSAIRANQSSFTPDEVKAVQQIAATSNLEDLINLIKQGTYQKIFN